MSEISDSAVDDERGSEVDDYSAAIPRVEADAAVTEPSGRQPSGFGDGDVADIDVTDTDTDPVADPVAEEAADPVPEVDVAALLAERDQLKDVAVRLQADFENFRKRTAAQVEDDIDRATARLAEALLPVLDAAEAAYVQHPDEIGPLFNVMLGELKRHGLEALDLDAQPFDPEVAEAVAHETGEGGEVVVAEVMRSGYRWRGKTLRPAMVRTKD